MRKAGKQEGNSLKSIRKAETQKAITMGLEHEAV